jgi:hypothetical protein
MEKWCHVSCLYYCKNVESMWNLSQNARTPLGSIPGGKQF